MPGKRSNDAAKARRKTGPTPAEVNERSEARAHGNRAAENLIVPQAEGPDEEAGEGLEEPARESGTPTGGCKPTKGGIVH